MLAIPTSTTNGSPHDGELSSSSLRVLVQVVTYVIAALALLAAALLMLSSAPEQTPGAGTPPAASTSVPEPAVDVPVGLAWGS